MAACGTVTGGTQCPGLGAGRPAPPGAAWLWHQLMPGQQDASLCKLGGALQIDPCVPEQGFTQQQAAALFMASSRRDMGRAARGGAGKHT